jgi:hypothetical protein
MRTKGPIKPIYTSNPKDPRIKAYNDSMTLYKTSKQHVDQLKKIKSVSELSYKNMSAARKKEINSMKDKGQQAYEDLTRYNKGRVPEAERVITRALPASVRVTKKNSIGIPTEIEFDKGERLGASQFKKPVQPVVYKKPDKPTENLNTKKTVSKNTTKKIAKVAAPKATVKAKPVSKPVEKVKPVSKPVDKVTMKPTTQEEAKKLKEGFKKQTGKEFKSQDSDYNKLEKKLGRKPTVAEYNKSIKKP